MVRRRRSIRSYSSEPPPREVIDGIIDTARRAPSAGFAQGIDFLVLDTPERLAEFWRLAGDPDAPSDPEPDDPTVLVLVFSDPNRYLARYSDPDKIEFGLDEADAWPIKFWDVDAAMAAMQLQLAAVDSGLGTWFFGVGDEDALRKALGVPDDRNLIGIVALGYRADDEKPMGSGTTRKRRPLAEQLHRNGWDR